MVRLPEPSVSGLIFRFGGLNAPLRSGKHTSFEGGVRVPAFVMDLSGGRHLGPGGRVYPHMVISLFNPVHN